jgi:hypothetical protein
MLKREIILQKNLHRNNLLIFSCNCINAFWNYIKNINLFIVILNIQIFLLKMVYRKYQFLVVQESDKKLCLINQDSNKNINKK